MAGPGGEHAQPVPLGAPAAVSPAGSVSVTVTAPRCAACPTLLAVSTYVSVWPRTGSPTCVLVSAKSGEEIGLGDGGGGVAPTNGSPVSLPLNSNVATFARPVPGGRNGLTCTRKRTVIAALGTSSPPVVAGRAAPRADPPAVLGRRVLGAAAARGVRAGARRRRRAGHHDQRAGHVARARWDRVRQPEVLRRVLPAVAAGDRVLDHVP